MTSTQKALSLVTNSDVRNRYLKWIAARHMTGGPPSIPLPKGQRLYPAGRFNDYVAIATQHPDQNEWRLVKDLMGETQGVFLDVGANVGAMSVLAHSTGLASAIIAFEPSHRYCEAWHHNVAANDVRNAMLIQAAVGDYDGIVEFRVDPGLPLNGKIDKGQVHFSKVTEKVRIVTLDSIMDAFGVESISLLKIDVEGAEPLVIKGAERLLSAGRVKSMLVEFIVEFMEDMGADPYVYVDTIRRMGFGLYAIHADGSQEPIQESTQALVDLRRSPKGSPERNFEGINLVAKFAA